MFLVILRLALVPPLHKREHVHTHVPACGPCPAARAAAFPDTGPSSPPTRTQPRVCTQATGQPGRASAVPHAGGHLLWLPDGRTGRRAGRWDPGSRLSQPLRPPPPPCSMPPLASHLCPPTHPELETPGEPFGGIFARKTFPPPQGRKPRKERRRQIGSGWGGGAAGGGGPQPVRAPEPVNQTERGCLCAWVWVGGDECVRGGHVWGEV